MRTLKRVITHWFGFLAPICFVIGLMLDIGELVSPSNDIIVVILICSGILMFFLFLVGRVLWDEYDDYKYYYYYPESSIEPEPEKKTIVITDTRCSACGAPLEDEVCSYCGTRAVIYNPIA